MNIIKLNQNEISVVSGGWWYNAVETGQIVGGLAGVLLLVIAPYIDAGKVSRKKDDGVDKARGGRAISYCLEAGIIFFTSWGVDKYAPKLYHWIIGAK